MDRRRLVWLPGLLVLACVILLASYKIYNHGPTEPATKSPRTSDAPAPPLPGLQVPSPAAAPKPRLIDELRSRLGEQKLREIAQRSVSIEDRAREDLSESEAAYARMATEWAVLCQEQGISEAERDAIEDEAIRKEWLSPPPH